MHENPENGGDERMDTNPGKGLALDPVEIRVLASLVEKAITTPEYYPLTVKALTAACNQKSNRDPVMSLSEAEVMDALERLRYNHLLVWQVDQAGSRTPKFRHALTKVFTFSPREVAVMCELMLRGPQTQGELRTHCARLVEFSSLDEVRETIEDLEKREGAPLVMKLPPGPGRREVRYGHLLGREEDRPASPGTGSDANDDSAREAPPSPGTRRETLEREVAELRKELEALRAEFADFKRQFE